MFRKRDIELIILEVLDCQDENDKERIKFLKENDDEFSWKDLAIFQNLAATLPTQLKVELPSAQPKELFVRKLNRLIFGKEDITQPEKFVPGRDDKKMEILEGEIAENKIDWSSLSVSETKSKRLSGFEEVKTKTSSIINESKHLKEIEENFEDTNLTNRNNERDLKSGKVEKESISLRKLVLVSVLLFVVIVAISVYMVISNSSAVVEVTEETQQVDTGITKLEEPINDSVGMIQPMLQATEVQKIEISNKSQNEQNVLPKAPPKLPDPIDAPLITTEEVMNKEETKVEEEISAPPPKEVIEETEESTFFVAVEEMPQPIGGLQGIQRMIQYPEIAKRAGVEGKVFVRAFVDENGNVVNAEIVKGIGAGCDEAALEAILKTKFTPGKQRGKPIKVQVTVPVLFRL